MPDRLDGWPVAVAHDLDDVLADVDVVYLLRIQRERIGDGARSRRSASTRRGGGSPPSGGALKPDTLVMHPGPMNRGVEIAGEVADSDAVAGDRAGRERCRGAHGRAVDAAGSGGPFV